MVKNSKSSRRNTSQPCVVCGGPIRDTWNGQDKHIKGKKHRDAVLKLLRAEQDRNDGGIA